MDGHADVAQRGQVVASGDGEVVGVGALTTFSGRLVDPLALRREDVVVDDVAHALAQINRFNGHTKFPISVAQHSVYVSRVAEAFRRSAGTAVGAREVALAGLIHDAAEAYLGDVTKWLKDSPAFAEYRAAETRAQSLVYAVFGVTFQPEVEAADRLMVRYEGWIGYGPDWFVAQPHGHPNYPPISHSDRVLVEPWEPWDWPRAEREFLSRFAELQA